LRYFKGAVFQGRFTFSVFAVDNLTENYKSSVRTGGKWGGIRIRYLPNKINKVTSKGIW